MMSKNIKNFFIIVFLFCGGKISAQSEQILKPGISNETQTKQYFQWQHHAKTFYKKADTLRLPFFDDFSYTDKFFTDTNTYKGVFPYDSMWMDMNVFLNNSMTDDAPSLGIVTFDGLNKYGNAYEPTYSNSLPGDRADTFTSRPIDLSIVKSGDTNVYLSFYYQPEGLGNSPESSDSLTVEYKNNAGDWVRMWGKEGSKKRSFKIAFVPLRGAAFLYKGFQFRFVNYASLSGNLDHWNLDYVYINHPLEARKLQDSNIKDVAFSRQPRSIFKNYFSVPSRQFSKSPTELLADSVKAFVSNNDVNDANTNFSFRSDIVYPNNKVFVKSPPSISQNLKKLIISNYKDEYLGRAQLLNVSGDTTKILTKYVIKPSPASNDYFGNDSTVLMQEMSDYYAYDDGSAEDGYGFEGTSNSLAAVRFSLQADDKLYGVLIHFNQGADNKQQKFSLMLWRSITTGSVYADTIARVDNLTPAYSNHPNGFIYYAFPAPIPLTRGDFYVGWLQTSDFFMNVGFDKNYLFINNKKPYGNIYYNTSGKWQENGVLKGTLMLRPYFGKTAVGEEDISKTADEIFIWPSPSSNSFHIRFTTAGERKIYLTDLMGRVVFIHDNVKESNLLVTPNVMSGVYILSVENYSTGKAERRKIIIE